MADPSAPSSFERHAHEGEPPEGPHLALYTDRSGLATAIPVGARLDVVIDPSRVDGIIPMILVRVSIKALTFRCGCMKPECTKVMKFSLKVTGWHPLTKSHGS